MQAIVILILILAFGPAGCKARNTAEPPASSAAPGGGHSMEGMAGPAAKTDGAPDGEVAPAFALSSVKRQFAGVTTGLAETRPLTRVIRAVGRIEVNEGAMAHLHIKFEGYIHQLYVNTTGEPVQAGQPLFSVYSPELLATQQEYLLAFKAARDLSGSPFAEVSGGANSLLAAARRRLQLWDIEDSHIDELERTGRIQNHLTIHTPITGVVLDKKAVVGMKVEPGEELYTVADLSKVWLLADFYESEIAQVRVGQRAAITVNAYPDRKFSGTVRYIYPYLEPETRTTKVRFELDNPGGLLKPQMYADVELRIDLGRRLAVPVGAVLDSGTRSLVFVEKGDGLFEPRAIRLGRRADDYHEVLGGLAEGERVVTSANFLIDSESRLQSAVNAMGEVGMADKQMPQARMGATAAPVAQERRVSGWTIRLTSDPSPPRRGENRLRIGVLTPDGRPGRARLRMEYAMAMPGMPLEKTEAKPAGDGNFEARVRFDMAGDWEVRIAVTPEAGETLTTAFKIPVGP